MVHNPCYPLATKDSVSSESVALVWDTVNSTRITTHNNTDHHRQNIQNIIDNDNKRLSLTLSPSSKSYSDNANQCVYNI